MFPSIDIVFPCIPFLRIINGMSSRQDRINRSALAERLFALDEPGRRPEFSVPWAADEQAGRIQAYEPEQSRLVRKPPGQREREKSADPDDPPVRRRGACPKPLRLEIYRRDEGICQLCGEVVLWGEATIDRVIPGSMGGRYVLDNAQLACGDCNSRKGSSLVLRFAYASKARRAVLRAAGRV
jgi:hypothetical protein